MSEDVLLRVDSLVKYYSVPAKKLGGKKRYVKAVDGVSFELTRGSSLGIVGESGCGKTTLVNTVLGLENATSGHVTFDGADLLSLKG